MTSADPVAGRKRVHLLLSSGGVRCLSYIGALEELEATGHEPATVSTCSAGTLVGALYCAGLGPAQMHTAVQGLGLRGLTGPARWRTLRRLWSLHSWPYALYGRSGFADAVATILRDQGLDPDPRLGALQRPLSTAAMDVAGQRLLVYSSDANPDMRLSELLEIAVAVPFLYPPHSREGAVLLDASIASHTPLWLASGQPESLPIVVLRTPAPSPPTGGADAARGIRRGLPTWVGQLMASSVVSRDTLFLERLPGVSVYDIRTDVSPLAVDLTPTQIDDLIDRGRTSVAELMERQKEGEPLIPSTGRTDDDRARQQAAELRRRHLDRLAGRPTSTVFLAHAREDKAWVHRLRSFLSQLVAEAEVSVWDDSYIRPGALWDATIEDAIRRAKVAVLFVSRDAKRSTYVNERELPLLRDRLATGELRLLWISVDGCLPPEAEQAIQGFIPPERALQDMDDAAADQTLAALARAIEDEYKRPPTGG